MIRTILKAAFCLCATSASAQNPVIQNILDAVNTDSLVSYVSQLSGETTVDVGNGPVTIVSRNKLNPGNAVAQAWIQQRLTEFGYTPTTQSFSATGFNVLAEKTGALYPDSKVILCGHYDAMPGGIAAAPAADDDGSGTCSVLEAARILAPYVFEHTIVFALWDEEEQGLVGSAFYAGVAASNDDTLVAVVNMDAIAYDGDGDGLARIHTRPTANSLAIKDTALLVNTAYGLNINLAINNPGATYSDHASFWNEGYGAILVIEDFDNDGNPHYHTPTDLLQYLTQSLWTDLSKLSIGTAATFAVPYGNLSVQQRNAAPAQLFAYPVPSTGDARVWVQDNAGGRVRLELVDAFGRTLVTMHEGLLAQGKQAFDVRLGDRAPGSYRAVLTRADGTRCSTALVRTTE
ncbi:MAG: M28 family peptidase [Flavobacteriales bacterium]